MKRKLLALVATDMRGFLRLIKNDEIVILSSQKSHFNEVIKPAIKSFNGEIIKTTDDGFLATFKSALDAANRIIEISIKSLEKIFNKIEITPNWINLN